MQKNLDENSYEKRIENIERQKNDFQTRNVSSKNSQKESFNDSSKNLADFFNGEIIDLDG